LPGQGRLGRAYTLPLGSMAGGAGRETPPGIASRPERWRRPIADVAARRRQARIIERNGAASPVVKRLGDRPHHLVWADARGVVLHLLLQVAGLEAGQAGDRDAVAHAVEAVAGEAGVCRSAGAATHRDGPPIDAQQSVGPGWRAVAGAERGEREKGESETAHSA